MERQAAAARASGLRMQGRPTTNPAAMQGRLNAVPPRSGPPPVTTPPVAAQPQKGPQPPVVPRTGVQQPVHPAGPINPAAANATPNPSGAPIGVNPATGEPELKFKDYWRLAPQDRPYFFTWNNTPLDKACHDFEEMSGLSMMNLNVIDQAKNKTVSFQSSKLMTYDEALTRFDEILFPLNFWVVHRENFLVIDQLTEWYRKIPPERMYMSLESYRKDKLPPWEVASVMYIPKFRPAELLQGRAMDVVPINGARATLVSASNRIELSGFVYWMERQLAVIESEDIKEFSTDQPDRENVFAAIMRPRGRVAPSAGHDPQPRRRERPGSCRAAPAASTEYSGPAAMPENPGQHHLFADGHPGERPAQQLVVKANEVNHKLVQEYLEKYIDLPCIRRTRGR